MKTKIYTLIIFGAAMLFAGRSSAQCGMRYQDSLFNYSVTTVMYDTYDSLMDIYQPVGDTSSKRPLIVLAHEGTFVAGDKGSDPTVVRLCQNFAQRGFVTASINYRLLSFLQLGDSTAVITEVIQALSDGKAAVRYFSTDAATANLYHIDTTRMFIGGNSAGAVLAMHYGYIDSVGQVPAYLQTIINANGGLEGNSGNSGHTSNVKAVISCAGGLNDPSWAAIGNMPSFNAQGSSDNVVPYYCGHPEGVIPVRLCGLGSIQPYYTSASINESSLVFPGQPHVPWDTSASMFYSVDSGITAFLTSNFVTPVNYCDYATGIKQLSSVTEISLYPNPASQVVNVHSSLPFSNINIYDETGRLVGFTGSLNMVTYQINTSNFSKGVYFMKFEMGDNTIPVVKRVVIE
jgi:para-nitrobenzyl esterase